MAKKLSTSLSATEILIATINANLFQYDAEMVITFFILITKECAHVRLPIW